MESLRSLRASPFHRFPPLPILFLAVFVDMVGFGIVVPVLPLYTERFGASPLAIGALLAIYSGMGFMFAPLAGLLADRFGRRKILLLSTIGQAAGFFIMGAATTVFWLFVRGASMDLRREHFRRASLRRRCHTSRKAVSRSRLARSGVWPGFYLRATARRDLEQSLASAPFYFASALAAANALLIFFCSSRDLANGGPGPSCPPKPFAQVGRGAKPDDRFGDCELLSLHDRVCDFDILLRHLHRRPFGFDASQNGYIFAGVGVIAVIVVQGGLLGPLVSRFGEKRLATVGVALLATSIFSLPLTEQISTLLFTGVGIAVGNALVNPTMSGLVSLTVDKYHQGRVLGLMQSGASLGRCLGPILGGWLVSNARHTLDLVKPPSGLSGAILLLALAVTATAQSPPPHFRIRFCPGRIEVGE